MWNAIIGGAIAGYGALKGRRAQSEADSLNRQQLQQETDRYNAASPLRNAGMQGLGQVEREYQMGNIGFNTQNPFAVARGPVASNATLGGWDKMTFEAPMETPQTQQLQGQQNDLAEMRRRMQGNPNAQRILAQAQQHYGQQQATASPPTTYGWQK